MSNRRNQNKKRMKVTNYCTYCHRRNKDYTTCYLLLGTCFNYSKNGHLSFECPQKKGNTDDSKYNYKMENKYRTSIVERQGYEGQWRMNKEEKKKNIML